MTNALLRPFCLLALSLPALAFAQASTLDKIKQSGTMTLAYRESSIPFSYLGGDAQPTGFGYEICEKIVDPSRQRPAATTSTPSTQAVTSANRIPLLQNGTMTSSAARPPTTASAASRSPSRSTTSTPARASW